LALSFQAAEEYYQTQGREWERYAMIKAIPLTGSTKSVEQIHSILRPFVFRRYLDFSAIQSLRELKIMIKAQVAKQGMQDNIKLGSGGIREIEFIGQAFQLIYGGKDTALQVRGIVPVLSLLAEKNVLPFEAVEKLLAAYTFLRLSENRLQMKQDQQTHQLPMEGVEQARLAYSMGYQTWDEYVHVLNDHRCNVAEQFDALFSEQTDESDISLWEGVWQQLIPEEAIIETLGNQGYTDSEFVWDEIKKFKTSTLMRKASTSEKQRVDKVFPAMLAAMAGQNKSDEGLKRGISFIRTIVHRSIYLVMLSENAELLTRLASLIARSGWIAGHLTQQPLLLDQLLDECLVEKIQRRPALDRLLEQRLSQCDSDHSDRFEKQLNELRRFKKSYVLNVATLDLTEKLPLMKVSDHLTDVAESCVQSAYRIAWIEMTNKHGFPHAWWEGQVHNPSLAVIGFGKLGGFEMGYGSDLDIVFLHDSHGERTHTSGIENDKGVIDNSLFFARLAQKLTLVINTKMVTGDLYEVDTRLRPDGASGEMVKSLDGFERYQNEKAWTWEHQALVRARFICGQESLKKRFEHIRHQILIKKRDTAVLLTDVIEMREKMRNHLGGKHGKISLKQDHGGLTDIEFMVQYIVLAWANQYPELTKWTDNIRILEVIGQTGVMEKQGCDTLIESYRTIRAKIHRLALDQQKAVVELHEINDDLEQAIEAVKHCWKRWMVIH